MANPSILRYPGGKTRVVTVLGEYVPSGTKEVCSLFFGGGSFEFYLENKGIKVHGYDNFDLLVNFWQQVKENSTAVYWELPDYDITKQQFYEYQKNIYSITDKVKQAAIFYVLNRCSFSGTTLSGGMSPNTPRYNGASQLRLAKFNSKIDVKLMSFEQSMPLHDCLIYADPPYLINQSLYGKKGDMHNGFNHILLAEMLNKRGNFILSYNNSDEVKELYTGHNFFYPEWKYGMGYDKKSREILIVSNDIHLIP